MERQRQIVHCASAYGDKMNFHIFFLGLRK